MIGKIQVTVETQGKQTQSSFGDFLEKGGYQGNAQDLANSIEEKVTKEQGKGLSSNDFTNEEKQKIQNNANKVITNASITGDVNKTLTLTFADGSILQTSFVDNQGGGSPSADVMLNSLNFDPKTGILKGVRSDGQELTVNLDGRYAPKEKDRLILVQRSDSNEIEVIREPSELSSMNMPQLDISKLPIFDNLSSKPQPLIAQGDYLNAPLLIAPAPFSSLVMRDGGIFNDFGALKMISKGQPKEFVFKEDLDYLIEQKIRQMQTIIGG